MPCCSCGEGGGGKEYGGAGFAFCLNPLPFGALNLGFLNLRRLTYGANLTYGVLFLFLFLRRMLCRRLGAPYGMLSHLLVYSLTPNPLTNPNTALFSQFLLVCWFWC